MCIFGIVHLLPDLCTQLVALLWCTGPGAVQSHTTDVQKCRFRQSAPHVFVNWHVSFWNRTPSVQGATGPPKLVYTASGTSTGHNSWRCTEPYSGCTKMLFAPECCPWPCELARALLELYT